MNNLNLNEYCTTYACILVYERTEMLKQIVEIKKRPESYKIQNSRISALCCISTKYLNMNRKRLQVSIFL